MKLRKLLMAALLVAGVFFIAGCSDDKEMVTKIAPPSVESQVKPIAQKEAEKLAANENLTQLTYVKTQAEGDSKALVYFSAKEDSKTVEVIVELKENVNKWEVRTTEINR